MTPVTQVRGPVDRRPRRRVFSRVLVALMSVVLLAGVSSSPVLAQDKIDEDTELDGRLFGYETNVGIEKDSTTPLWFVYFFLVVVGCVVLFKSAKRE